MRKGGMSKAKVESVIKSIPKAKRAATICALVGHSRLTTYCMGYLNCGRCGVQVGDTLMGSSAHGVVIERHGTIDAADCDCADVARRLTWRDTLGIRTPVSEWLETGERTH